MYLNDRLAFRWCTLIVILTVVWPYFDFDVYFSFEQTGRLRQVASCHIVVIRWQSNGSWCCYVTSLLKLLWHRIERYRLLGGNLFLRLLPDCHMSRSQGSSIRMCLFRHEIFRNNIGIARSNLFWLTETPDCQVGVGGVTDINYLFFSIFLNGWTWERSVGEK